MFFVSNPLEKEFIITSGYGQRGKKFHYGVDLIPKDKSICDCVNCFKNDAKVLRSYYSKTAGNTVILESYDEDDRWIALYCHLEDRYVDEGVILRGKVKVGKMGNTGISKGAHLHFQLHKDVSGKQSVVCLFGKLGNLDPAKYIK